MNFGKAIKFGGTAVVGYSCLYLLMLRPPDCFMSFEYVDQFVFKLAGWILFKNFVGVGVLQ